MSQTYDNARFGVEKILTFPSHCDLISAIGTICAVNISEDVVLTEFGVCVSEAITLAGTLPVVTIQEGSTVLGTITIPSGTAIGVLITTTTLTTTNLNAGDTLLFYRNTSCASVGELDGYVKFRERFVSG